MLKRNETLIKTKLWQYLVPSILTNMALQIGNVTDTILVGNFMGPDAMSAVQIAGTVLLLIQIPGWMLGIGGSIVVGNLLGKRDVDTANSAFSSCVFATLASGVALMAMSVFADPVAAMLTGGGTSALTADVAAVTRLTFLSTPIIGIALLMMNFMSVDNNPQLSTVYVVISNVVDLVSEYLMLVHTDWGASTSIISTALGYGAALVVLVLYVRSPKRMLKLVNPLRTRFAGFVGALKTGVPALLSIVCEMIRNTLMNIIILTYIGDAGVAVYTICLNLVMVAELFLGGIVEAMDKIGGVIYGERDYFGIRSLVSNILRYCYSILAVLMVALFAFTAQAAAIFGLEDPTLMDAAVVALRIFVLALPGYVFNRFFISYYQTTEQTRYSSLIEVLEYVGALIPAVWLCAMVARALGLDPLNSIMVGFVLGELLTAGVTVVVVRLTGKGEGILLLPAEQDEDVLDVSLEPSVERAGEVPRMIRAFCEGKIESTQANQIAVAAEEMAVNAIRYGDKSLTSLDLMLSITDDAIVYRQRDNGIPFDPTSYEYDSEGYEYSGIELVRRITDRIDYLRMLEFNNTTLEIDR